MMGKHCTKCGTHLPLTEFYRHTKMKDGHLSACKECVKAAVRANRARNVDYYRAYDRARANDLKRYMARLAYSMTDKGRQAQRRASTSWDARNPEQKRASNAVNNAIRDGRLHRQPCEVCGEPRAHAHHDDYSRPLDVRWLCATHHAAHHRQEREAARSAA